jgi:hypothetical protein
MSDFICPGGRLKIRRFSGHLLPAADDAVTVEAVDLDRPIDAVGRLGGDERRAGPGERLENNVVAGADVQQGVFQQRPRLDGRVDCEALARVRADR